MVQFKDLEGAAPNIINSQIRGWLEWCRCHDWGQGPNAPAWYDTESHEMVTYGGLYDGFTNYAIKEARHASPRDLKAWAGYWHEHHRDSPH